MKAKIKLELTGAYDFRGSRNLNMRIEVKDENPLIGKRYYRYTIIKGDDFKFMSCIDNFYDVLYDFITDKEQIIEKGKEFVKDIIKNKLKEQKKEEVEKLLKNFKSIEIEVKE